MSAIRGCDHVEIEEAIAEGDRVVVILRGRGTAYGHLEEMRDGIASLDGGIRAYLESARGRFERRYAARERRRRG